MALASERLQYYISTWMLMPLRRLTNKSRVLLITALFLTLIYILHGSLSGSEAPLSEDSRAQNAKDVQTKLESMVEMPIDISDFKGMGERTAAFASLTEALVADPNLNRTPLLSLLKQQFPWLQHVKRRWHTPFSNLAGAETGLVICVGSKDFLLAAHLIRTLRDVLGSSLPIEIAYAGESDLLATERDALKALDSKLETINLLEYYDESIAGLQNGRFAMKPFALLASRFRKAILVDADVLFLQRPDTIFETHPMLKETGTLFWHDRAYPKVGDFSRRDWIKGLLNGKQPSAMLNQSLFWEHDLWQEMDSGVVCIDKAKTSAFMGLIFASWMNTEKVRNEVVYEHVLGDKETFWLASELSSFAYYFHPTYAGIIGNAKDTAEGKRDSMCSVQMLHFDADRKPFWYNGSLRKNKAFPKNRDFATFTHYMPGSVDMEQNPAWKYKADNVWCASGVAPVPFGNEELMTKMVKVAQEVDGMYPDY